MTDGVHTTFIVDEEARDIVFPALEVVREFDPELYERIIATGWHIVAVDPFEDIMMMANAELGVTFGSDLNHMDHSAFSRYGLALGADNMQADPVDLAAQVLVHEYCHVLGKGEAEAYPCGIEFISKLPPERSAAIAQNMRETMQKELLKSA